MITAKIKLIRLLKFFGLCKSPIAIWKYRIVDRSQVGPRFDSRVGICVGPQLSESEVMASFFLEMTDEERDLIFIHLSLEQVRFGKIQ